MDQTWHVITGEYPPSLGGVADYTYQLAGALADSGDSVHVWCATARSAAPSRAGVEVHSNCGSFLPADLYRVGRSLNAIPGPRRLLVQWVPHAFGLQAMNLPFCLWVLKRAALSGDAVDLMIHEAFLDNRGTVRQRIAATVQRVMMTVLLLAATRVWVSVPRWWRLARPYSLGRQIPAAWLPVPSNVPTNPFSRRVDELRIETTGAPTVGHFGSFGTVTDDQLLPILEAVLDRCPNARLRLVGRGASSAAELLGARMPYWSNRIIVADSVSLEEVACQIAACDVMIQPYLDGVSSRRTSFMACLALGTAAITHAGESSEPVWEEVEACALVEPVAQAYADAANLLLADRDARKQLGRRALSVYDERFHVRHTVSRIRQTVDPGCRPIDTALGSRIGKDQP